MTLDCCIMLPKSSGLLSSSSIVQRRSSAKRLPRKRSLEQILVLKFPYKNWTPFAKTHLWQHTGLEVVCLIEPVRSSFALVLLPMRIAAYQPLHPASALLRTSRRALLSATLEVSRTSSDNGLIHRSTWADAASEKV